MTTAELQLSGVKLIYNRGRIDQVDALRGVDVEVPAGQFVTIVGANGAGKSSMVKVIAGAVRPTGGTVRIGGRDVTRKVDWQRAGLVARVFDDPRMGTAPELSIEDNFALAMSSGRRRTLRWAVTSARRATMREGLSFLGLGLEDRLQDPVGMLSAGQRQSLTMVMATMSNPRVLLLDEHLAALDPRTARRVLDLTCELALSLGCTTLMITHNMEHAIKIGDRLLVMGGGRILADVQGDEKAALTPDTVVDLIVSSGGVVSDRTLLAETDDDEA